MHRSSAPTSISRHPENPCNKRRTALDQIRMARCESRRKRAIIQLSPELVIPDQRAVPRLGRQERAISKPPKWVKKPIGNGSPTDEDARMASMETAGMAAISCGLLSLTAALHAS